LIFEDIDAMGEAVKCRDTKTKEIKKKKEEDFIKVDILHDLLKEGGKEGGAGANVMGANVMGANVMVMGANVTNQNNLSYLLNMFDGINECSGRIIIMTSNKPEVLDKALIRPGRIDIKIHFNNCTTYDVMRLINLFWDLEVTEAMLRPDLNMKYTSAEIYNIFRSTNDFQDIKALFLQK
jgi:SpoVK/Ycf46/Vps4 family AAA+-type ATPase